MIPRALFALICSVLILQLSPAPVSAQTPITWVNTVNVTVTGSVVQKTGGCDGCQDAGATSQEELTADGYIEFTVGELNTLWMAGLSHGNDDATYQDIDFGFRFNGAGYADVLENGAYAGGDTTYAAGDVFRVTLANGRIEYSKNGRFLMESAHAPQLPLLVCRSMHCCPQAVRPGNSLQLATQTG